MSRLLRLNPAGRMLIVLAFMMLCVPCASLRAQNADPNQLSGLWAITFTLPPNPLLPTTVRILANFTTDGNFVFSDSLGKYGPDQPFPLPSPFTQSPGQGQWVRTAKGQFIINAWHIVFDNNGKYFGVSRGRGIIQYDPKAGTVTGTNYLELIPEPPFPPLPGLPGTITGKRLPVEPPPAP